MTENATGCTIRLNAEDTEALERAAEKTGTIPQAFAVRAIRERIAKLERALKRLEK